MASDRGRGIAVKYRIALAFVATSCMAGMSFAADLPVSGPYRPGPFVVRQPVEWTGLYFGANAGYGWGKYSSNITFSGASTSGLTNPITGITPQGTLGAVAGPTELSGTRVPGSGSPSGAIVGGQIGFNWQAGMFVFGGEIDGQWSGQENTFSTVCGTGCSATESIKIRSLATGRGRLGLAFDWFMPYVTGGAAMATVSTI
jgi:outer membrane immunogenic protein